MISLPTRWRSAGQYFSNSAMSTGCVGAVADGGHVVGEGVEPDVDDVFLCGGGGGGFGDGDAPGEAGAGDGEVFEGSGDVGVAEGGVGEGLRSLRRW